MIKKTLKIHTLGALLVSTSILANTQSNCDDLIGCKKKSCYIEQNIAVAKKMENEDKIKGLQISLVRFRHYMLILYEFANENSYSIRINNSWINKYFPACPE